MRYLGQHPLITFTIIVFSVGALGTWPWLFIPLTLAAATAFLIWLGKQAHRYDQAQAAQAHAIAQRATYEHWLTINGDPAGTYGQYPPVTA